MSYLDGIDITTAADSERAIRAIRAARPLHAVQARQLIAIGISALEKANAEDDAYMDITVKRMDLIRQLGNMDERLASAKDGALPESAAEILRTIACEAIDEFDAAADDVPALADERESIVSDVLGATAPVAAADAPSGWTGRLKTLAIVAGVGLAMYGAFSIAGKSGR